MVWDWAFPHTGLLGPVQALNFRGEVQSGVTEGVRVRGRERAGERSRVELLRGSGGRAEA